MTAECELTRRDGAAPAEGQAAPIGGEARTAHSDLRAGIRAGLPFALATFVLGASFGVLAEPVMGAIAPIVMSIVVFAGAAQFAALSVLAIGGGAPAAVAAGLLLNARFLPMGFAIAPSLRGRPLRRAAEGQALVDASFAIASRGDGSFDRGLLLGATFPQAVAWISGTVLGVLGGTALADPDRFGLDAIFPAFYLALLVEEVRNRHALAAALIGAAIALALMPAAPAGVPVIAASIGALVGLRRS
jgi:4-azaleucine resistance transporter AzlC